MFLCRRQLLRVHFLKFSPSPFDLRRFFNESKPTSSPVSAVRVHRRGPRLPSSPCASEPQEEKTSANALRSTLDQLEQLSEDTDITILERTIQVATQHAYKAECEPLIQRLHPLLLKRLRSFHVPAGMSYLQYHPPTLVYRTFNFAHKLAICSRGQLALDLLHVLFDQGFIPNDAIQCSEDVCTAVSVALARACLHWDWKPVTTKILLHLFRSARPSNHFVFELAVDTSHALLVTPNDQNVRECLYLFLQMHHLASIPPKLVQLFYDAASKCRLGREAADFYSFSRRPAVQKCYRYPPPQGKTLMWLMRYLTTGSKKMHLSRTLAAEVAADKLPVSAQFRARFITLAASQGYSSIARKLWSRYSKGEDSHLVVGNSALMLRMMSLYAYLIRRATAQCQEAGTDDKKHVLQCQLNDLVSFRDHVFQSFEKYHDPLKNAPHEVVTSYARACFIIGKTAEGFNALGILFRQKEVPDMYDINVALSAIAQIDPRSATLVINQLKDRGFKPDAVSYTTVMHFARVHGDLELELEMIDELCRLDKGQMNFRSVAALVRAVVRFEDGEKKSSQRRKLRGALDIVMKMTLNQFLRSPQTGKFLVTSSLQADDPTMAYHFWDLLLRETTEWEDAEQAYQRSLISKMIVSHRECGLLEGSKAQWMLKRLEQQPGLILSR